MVRPVFESAVAGLNQAAGRFERSAAQVTRLAGAYSAAESAVSVNISAEARGPAPTQDSAANATLEGAIVDTRIANTSTSPTCACCRPVMRWSARAAKIGSDKR